MRNRFVTRFVVGVLVAVAATIGFTPLAYAGEHGVVASDHALASEAGAEVLRKGGNAVDAAVATSFALSVVRPDSCGIGGGGFMVIHIAEHDRAQPGSYAINYRETCPSAIGPLTYEQWGDAEASRYGGRAVGVPGTVAGLLAAHERFGVLPRGEVLAPAIRLAEQGFEVDAHHAATAAQVATQLTERDGWATRFAFVHDRLVAGGGLRPGDRIANPEQGRVLRRIARLGQSGFYGGEVAADIVQAVEDDGGVLSLDDLLNYEPVWTEPLAVPYRDVTLLLMPPPSSGGVAIAQMFGIIERVGIGNDAADPSAFPDVATSHVMIEAMKHAFADRAAYMADPGFVDVPVQRLLDDAYLDERAALIDPTMTRPIDAYGTREPPPADGGTSHFSVADRFGNVVSCTETINLAFGSLLAPPRLGFCLNNEMDDFTTRRGEANAFGLRQSDDNLPEPGKRPLSSMSPSVVLGGDGRAIAAAGASGGPRIITSTWQALLRVLVWGASAAEAVAAPRLHHQWLPNAVRLEQRGDPAARDKLEADLAAIGHEFGTPTDVGAVQLIRLMGSGGWDAASDPRKGGQPAFE